MNDLLQTVLENPAARTAAALELSAANGAEAFEPWATEAL